MDDRGRRCGYNAALWRPMGRHHLVMVTRIGPLATISCEPGQARKGAAAAVDLGAGVWLVRATSLSRLCCYNDPLSVVKVASLRTGSG